MPRNYTEAAKPISCEELAELRKEAATLHKTGEDLLFWAGQLAAATGKIPLTTPCDLSAVLTTVDKIRREYDAAIILATGTRAQEECRKGEIGFDPEDIEATLGWMETARKGKDSEAMADLFWKIHLQIDALEEEYNPEKLEEV